MKLFSVATQQKMLLSLSEGSKETSGFGVAASLLCALALVAVLNVLFLVFALWGATISTEAIAERVRDAYKIGELTQDDWRRFDTKRGFNQYNDCLVMQMVTNYDEQIASKAIGPLLYVKDDTYTEYCTTLFNIVSASDETAGYMVTRYARYWHGYMPLSAALLHAFDLTDIRLGLKITTFGALILLIVAAGWQHRGLLAIAASIAATGMFFWGLPYFGQSLSHAPGDAFVILGISCLLFWRERLARLETFIPFCAAYGAGVVYLEFLTGLLPTAAGLMLPIAYLIAMSRPERENYPLHGWMFAIAGVTAFAAGGVVTVVIKQILALVVIGSLALESFLGNLDYYTSMPAPAHENPTIAIFMPFVALIRQGMVLTYGSITGAILLYATTALAWLVAGWLAVRRKGAQPVSDFLAFTAGAVVVVVWVVLFPTHTLIHSSFMVRILIVPIALGWGALVWQLMAASGADRAAFQVNR